MKMEDELRNIGDQLRFAMGLAGMGISIIDLQGRCLSWSELTKNKGEAAGRQFAGPIQLEEAEFKEVMRSVARKGIYDGVVELSRKDGSRICNRLIVTKLSDNKGVHVGFICITKEGAEKKETEEKSGKKDDGIDEFIYTLCHDLKTPLCAIEGYSSLLVEDYGGKIDDEGRDYLGRIVDNTTRMANLIDQLKEYSDATKPIAPYEKADLSEVAREALTNINHHIEGKKIKCTIGHLPTVYCEKPKMIQVFNHLLENSIRFSENENPTIEIDCEEEGHMYHVSVKRGEKGLAMENRDKALQMAQCLSGEGNYFAGGLGLAIAKKIVENHGGNVWTDNEPTNGSAFYFTLPKGKNRSTWNVGKDHVE